MRLLPGDLADEFEYLLDHLAALLTVLAHRRDGAVLQMVAHEVAGDGVERFPYGRHLVDDVSAIPILIDHRCDPADLALDAPQVLEVRFLDRCFHADGTLALPRSASCSHALGGAPARRHRLPLRDFR